MLTGHVVGVLDGRFRELGKVVHMCVVARPPPLSYNCARVLR